MQAIELRQIDAMAIEAEPQQNIAAMKQASTTRQPR